MNLLKLNDTSKVVPFFMADSTTKAGKPGLSLAVTLSKNGAAFVASAATSVLDRGNGHYAFTPAAGDVDTLGPLVFRAAAAGADDFAARYSVVAFDPYDVQRLGLTALPAAGTLAVKPAVTLAAADVIGNLTANTVQWGGAAVGGVPNSGNVIVGGYAAGQDPATLVLDASASAHVVVNSVGARLNAPGGAGSDPWAISLPGGYAPGTAGAILGGDFQNALAAMQSQMNTLPTGFPANFSAMAIDPATGGVTVASNHDKAGYNLAPSGLDAIAVEVGVNARQALSPILAASAGVVSGAGTGTVVIKGGNVPDVRIQATTDKSGNRTSVTLTLPPSSTGGSTAASSYYFSTAYFPTAYFPMGKTGQAAAG